MFHLQDIKLALAANGIDLETLKQNLINKKNEYLSAKLKRIEADKKLSEIGSLAQADSSNNKPYSDAVQVLICVCLPIIM